MLLLADAWVWDFWLADTGTEYHLFFLRASRALGDPDRRHRRASVGHAVSSDLHDWTLLPDAIVPADEPRWDDLAIWTGSVLAGPDGVWRMFYTALSRADDGCVQRIGVASSTDLTTWQTRPSPLVTADPRWYETLPDGGHEHEFWRDPWVFPDPGGDGWHMLVTARSRTGPDDQRGVIGHAVSADLHTWSVRPPLSEPGSGFGQLEVPQVAVVEGHPVLVFSCLGADLAVGRGAPGAGGSWIVAAESLTGPFDVGQAQLLLDEHHYSTRLVADRAGQWQALAFVNADDRGRFVGAIADPVPVRRISPTRLTT